MQVMQLLSPRKTRRPIQSQRFITILSLEFYSSSGHSLDLNAPHPRSKKDLHVSDFPSFSRTLSNTSCFPKPQISKPVPATSTSGLIAHHNDSSAVRVRTPSSGHLRLITYACLYLFPTHEKSRKHDLDPCVCLCVWCALSRHWLSRNFGTLPNKYLGSVQIWHPSSCFQESMRGPCPVQRPSTYQAQDG